jgi:ABC-type branched-subunit amino acid transport system substrate-binding protein
VATQEGLAPAPTDPSGLPGTVPAAAPLDTEGAAAAAPGGSVPVSPGSPGSLPGQAGAGAVTTPFVLGVIDQPSLSETAATIGSDVQQNVSYQDAVRALVQNYNAHGGIAGRRIKLVEYTMEATDASWDTEFEAACAKFTQDTHVDAVITAIGGFFSDSYETCLSKAGAIDIEAYTIGAVDDDTYARYPRLFTVGAITVNRKISGMLNVLTSRGHLSKANKIGVIVEDCSYNVRAFNATFVPLARRLGLSIVRRDIGCLRGFNGLGAFASQVSANVLPFRTDGVDRVMFVSGFEWYALASFSQTAHSQQYAPFYALSSATQPGANISNYPKDDLPRMTGVGWLPDTDLTADPVTSSATRRCRSIFTSLKIVVSTKADRATVDVVCDAFFLLEAGLTASKGHAREALVSGLESLGTSYVSPYSLTGATRYDEQRHDGPRTFSVFTYKTSCSCFTYVSRPAALA